MSRSRVSQLIKVEADIQKLLECLQQFSLDLESGNFDFSPELRHVLYMMKINYFEGSANLIAFLAETTEEPHPAPNIDIIAIRVAKQMLSFSMSSAVACFVPYKKDKNATLCPAILGHIIEIIKNCQIVHLINLYSPKPRGV